MTDDELTATNGAMTDPLSYLPTRLFIMRDGSRYRWPVEGDADGPEIHVGRRWGNGQSFGQQIRFVKVREGEYQEVASRYERTSHD